MKKLCGLARSPEGASRALSEASSQVDPIRRQVGTLLPSVCVANRQLTSGRQSRIVVVAQPIVRRKVFSMARCVSIEGTATIEAPRAI